jgi:hypothetical protein
MVIIKLNDYEELIMNIYNDYEHCSICGREIPNSKKDGEKHHLTPQSKHKKKYGKKKQVWRRYCFGICKGSEK